MLKNKTKMTIIDDSMIKSGGGGGGGAGSSVVATTDDGSGGDDDEKKNMIVNQPNHYNQFNYFNYWNKNSKQLIKLDAIEIDLDDKNENEDLNEAFIDDDYYNNTTKTSSEQNNDSSNYYYLRKFKQYQFEIDNFFNKEKETLIEEENNSNSIESIVINLPINNNLEVSQQNNILKSPHHNLVNNSNSPSNNLITTTRFLHPVQSSASLENNSSSSLTVGASNLLLTPTTTRTSNNNNNNNDTSASVVSKLKSWFKKPTNMNATSNQNNNNNNNNNSQLNRANSCGMEQTAVNLTSVSSSVLLHQPLSIDLVRKLKRPINIPYSLEYNSNQIFQGSVLEEWIMQALDDYIKNTPAIFVPNLNNNLINMNELTSSTYNMNNSNTPLLGSQSQSSIVIENFEETYIINCDPTNNGSTTISKASCVMDDRQASFVSKINNKLLTNSDSNLVDNPTDEVMFDLPSNTNNHNNNNINNTSNDTNNVNNNNNNNMSLNLNALRRQEANFYVQQILTNLIAIGVLEYESGFENAINKTFKVIIDNYQ
jgi:hypothetical protein